ncbi:unnamed protein product, partial [Iphiclides podalirius]
MTAVKESHYITTSIATKAIKLNCGWATITVFADARKGRLVYQATIQLLQGKLFPEIPPTTLPPSDVSTTFGGDRAKPLLHEWPDPPGEVSRPHRRPA